LPHVPWFALRTVYEASREQYIERSGGFLVAGYGEWIRRYAFAPAENPVHDRPRGFAPTFKEPAMYAGKALLIAASREESANR
jgi:hypothetical protein